MPDGQLPHPFHYKSTPWSAVGSVVNFLQKRERSVGTGPRMKNPLQSLCLLSLIAVISAACQPHTARESDKDPIIGKYDWLVNGSSHRGTTHIAYEGHIIDVYESENPRSAGARVAGSWKVLDKEKRQYLLHWKDPWNEFRDTLILSEDGNYLKGTNNYGALIEGKRVRPSKASSGGPDPHAAKENAAAALRAMKAENELRQAPTGSGTFKFKGNGFLASQIERGMENLRIMSESDDKWRGIDAPSRPRDWLYKLWPDQ